MEKQTVYDLVGIGIGPFNLGLAALVDSLNGLSSLFFDQSPEFLWHGGMLLESSSLQVPFFADLVTLADPSSPYSFLAYLKEKGQLFRFAIRENNYISRREYNRYCRWVTGQLPNLVFHSCVGSINYREQESCYEITVYHSASGEWSRYLARHLAIGVGSLPCIPEAAAGLDHPDIFHSSQYLYHRKALPEDRGITILGSGQSAAEIFYDLLGNRTYSSGKLSWITRSSRFYPMETSKLSYEMSSPQYIEYFFGLPTERKKPILDRQHHLYRGINQNLIGAIYDLLYHLYQEGPDPGVQILTCSELRAASLLNQKDLELTLYHLEEGREFRHLTQVLILATGYRYEIPGFLEPIRARLVWNSEGLPEVRRNYSVDLKGREVFVQNAEMHTHGFNAPDLGLGTYRNACILNTILGRDHFRIERNSAFQTFGLPGA